MKILKGPSDEETLLAFHNLSASEILYSIFRYDLDKSYLDLAFNKMMLLNPQEVLDLAIKYRLDDAAMDIAINKGILKNISIERLLTKSVQAGSLKYVKYALDKGAGCNPIPGSGLNALMLAAKFNFIEISKTIIKHGVDINIADRVGWTALFHAVYHSNNIIAELLISADADINIQDENGKTALMYAVIKDNLYIAKLLCDNGADLLLKDNNHRAAYDFCRSRTETEVFLRQRIIQQRRKLHNF